MDQSRVRSIYYKVSISLGHVQSDLKTIHISMIMLDEHFLDPFAIGNIDSTCSILKMEISPLFYFKQKDSTIPGNDV